jgi:putative phosphoesterase
MKVAILADIHGNASALAAVLEVAQTLGVERLLCAGDCVGYYDEPGRCLELLADWDVLHVRGNHEDMLQHLIADPSVAGHITQRYGSGLSVAARELTPDQLAALQAWPVQRTCVIDDVSITLCHGAPWETDHYVYPDADDDTLQRCAASGTDYVVMGHTHYRFSTQIGTTRLVNPGSVGQPRDRRPGAAWSLVDTVTGEYQSRTEPYDIAAVAMRARARDPHLPYLWDVLTRR